MLNLCRFHMKCLGSTILRQNGLKDVVRIISTSAPAAQKANETRPLADRVGHYSAGVSQRELKYMPRNRPALQAWVESMVTTERDKVGLFDLHPSIFGTFPRIDVLWWNIHWQRTYQHVNYEVVKTRAELPGGGRKPWPQKGTGRARHGSRNSPLFKGGGKSFGPRGPKSYFYMLSKSKRILGLRVALSCKYAQNNFYVVNSLDIPSDEPQFLEDLIENRGWGLSVLFVDTLDVLPRNFAIAIDKIPQYNAMPVYGLNVYSLLKHETLVLTTRAVEALEERLLFHMNHVDFKDKKFKRISSW